MTDQDEPKVPDTDEPEVPSDPTGAGDGSAHNAAVKVEENN